VGTAVLQPAIGSSFFGPRSEENSGILGGGQVGFNLQAGTIVFGLEADVQGVGFEDDGLEKLGTKTALQSPEKCQLPSLDGGWLRL
jgi:hypothetical protein